ncbi:Co-chaperone Hsc20 [Cucurbitaria berberidis CBS 394.84]|uniref:Co-chaperone Hsc20 n=1 Tax=Cucurbitaria berberidis CBS 394.84 TaxID=1168544 RepID=A0A9P4L5L3_9PLEO|nr:Co-chaperone Hsc20 [Cucurbitaria berberidis CBS 394.84]KAF1842795.1 Co-chaperone Hsc20 [Cucurbitaria berberidis CBS 394.84]
MRTIRPTSARRLRASLTSEPSISPFRAQHRATPCLLCAHRIPPQIPAHRFQSTSAGSNTRETPFDAQTSPLQQSSQPQTHYAFFPNSVPTGPPPEGHFTIDLNALKKEFLQLQARAHPDLHPQANKKRAEALSSRINEAYKTLQDPLRRAQYVLSLRGIEVAEDETAKVEDPELLMEVLEAREQIEEAEKEEDLVEMKTVNEERIAESTKVLEQAFREDDLQTAKSETVKLRYWINIRESIHSWEKGVPVVLQH